MSADDIDRPARPAISGDAPAPYIRHHNDAPIELVIARPGGAVDVHTISDDIAHLMLVDLSVALLRRRPRAALALDREPA